MKLDDLREDVIAVLSEQKRQAMEVIVNEFHPSEACQFALALIAGITARDRRIARLFLNDLEKIDVDFRNDPDSQAISG